LMDMGVDTYLVASSLRAVLAQRLIKKLCPHCTQPYEPDAQEKTWLESMEPGSSSRPFLHGRGCHHCHNTGYQGRVGIYELLELNSEMISALRQSNTQGFADAAASSQYFRPLALSALDFATDGVTSLDEVFRVSATLDGEDF
ncbi:MAG: MSHA biogenesis protein MshE, partial [Thalassolituus sp.]